MCLISGALCETFVGTTCYMSPERLAGDQYNYAADLWAHGLILLELATGKYPYPKSTAGGQLFEMDGRKQCHIGFSKLVR